MANTSTKRKRVSASALARRQPTRLRFVLVLAAPVLPRERLRDVNAVGLKYNGGFAKQVGA
jgi:hypothetical protein